MSKELLRKETKDEMEDELKIFFDFFVEYGTFYRDIDEVVGSSVEKNVYEYFKLKRNKQLKSVLLALKIQKSKNVLTEQKYEELILLLRNFFVIFNLDRGQSNRTDNDMYVLSNKIYTALEELKIEYEIIEFLLKFSTYFSKDSVLENGLKNIIYSNKSARKNISSKLLVYLFKPLLIEDEENKYIQYDFSKFNVEHILNDNIKDEIRYSLGNLLLCPNELNSVMRNAPYEKKREKLISSGIPHLKKLGERYDKFDEKEIGERTIEVTEKLKAIYLIQEQTLKKRKLKIQIYYEMKEQLIEGFGTESDYVKELEKRGIDKFTEYIFKNGSLPKDQAETIKKWIDQLAS